MSVRLLIGRAGTGKTTFCLNEMRQQMLMEPDGEPIIYLVPDQMTFLSEYKLVTMPGMGGMMRTQVYSFSRLAWRVLQETGGISRYHLNTVGISMLIRKILEEQKEDLKLFQRAADKKGFIAQMEQILTEFKRYTIRPEELADKEREWEATASNKRVLQDKIHDLQLLFQAFEDSLQDKYVDSEDYLRLLGEKISSSHYLKNAHVYIDGFYSFTPQEYMIIESLMKHCRNVSITFTLDAPYYDNAPDDLHLFRMSGETCQTIYEIARINGMVVEEILFNEQKRLAHESLQHLETYFDSRPAISYKNLPLISIGEAVNRRAEIEGIARNIRKLVMEEDYRYRDFALLVRNSHEYQHIIETVFSDFEVPVFFDEKRPMLYHPLIELIRSSLEVITGYWRYEPVFRAVKTELLYPFKENPLKMREKMDRLENYVLAYGIQGAKWTKRVRWKYRRYRGLELENIVQTDAEKEREDELNELRKLISQPLQKMAKRFKGATNGRQYCEALYLFLEELDVPAKLERWKIEEEDKGNLIKAREHDQAWNATLDLLDQFVELLGEESITLKQFSVILDAGMESLNFSLVPPAMDQVLAANLDNSRLSDVKIAFVIGLTEGVLPAKFSEEGLLSDDDRETLLQRGLKIAPSSRTRLLDEEFHAYHAFTSPSDRLYITYPLADEEGKSLVPSSYIQRMIELFPSIQKVSFSVEPSELSENDQLDFVANEHTTLSYLTSQLQLKKRKYPIYDFWWDVYNHYLNDEDWKEKSKKALSSLNYQNLAQGLSDQTSKQLYGDEIRASVSRMEIFHSCPFSHFARHGLKLSERQIFRLDAPDIGELFHGALKYIAETIMVSSRSWKELEKSEIEQLAREAVEVLAPKLQNEILLSSNRHHYIKRKLEQIIRRASLVLSEHAKASGFAPVGLELGFGPKEKLPSLKFPLRNGTKMELAGRIDRVDLAENENGVYLRVIDYKSSYRDLDLREVYHGLALQMLTYLDIIIANSESLIGKKAEPAGVLYFHVHNPIVNTKKMLTTEQIEEELLKRFKMNGLLLSDERVVRLMDQTLESGNSTVVSAGVNKDGTLRKNSKAVSRDELDSLMGHVRGLYRKAGDRINAGDVAIAPYKLNNKTACTFCAFKDVCQFDESLEANQYRKLNVKKDEVLDLIRKEADTDGENGHSSKA